MRPYDDVALRRLREEETRVEVFGTEVAVKKATAEDRPGMLDPWLLAREAELRAAGRGKRPQGLRMLFMMLFRPEQLLIELRGRAEAVVLSPDDHSTLDLAEGEITVDCEELRLHEHPTKLWKYEPTRPPTGPRPCFLHVHGGGFFAGKPTGRDNMLKYVADRADAVVFDLDYSLSPEVKFPHAVHETHAAVRHLHEHAEEYGIDPARIVVGGGSGGANLTAAATLLEKKHGTAMIAHQVLMSPAVIFGRTTPPGYRWSADDFVVDDSMRDQVGRIVDPAKDRGLKTMTDAYRGSASTDDPLISPALTPDLSGLPPALVMTSEMDSLRPQGEYYAARLEQAGVPVRTLRYRGIMHASAALFGYIPQAEAMAQEIVGVLASTRAHQTAPDEEHRR